MLIKFLLAISTTKFALRLRLVLIKGVDIATTKFKLRLRSFSLSFLLNQLLSSYFVFDLYSLRALVCLRLNSSFDYRLAFVKFSGNGDGEIRTLDPLLARQVLSQLSYTPGVVLASTYSPIPSPV